jgi:hypothetical protein
MSDFLVNRKNLHEGHWREAEPAPLAANAARLKVDAFALTANNVTYAAFGEAMRYWDFFPAPEGLGRVPVWGFATVEASNVADVKPGARVYGYLPMSHAFDLTPIRVSPNGFFEGGAHRAALSPFYNMYTYNSADPAWSRDYEPQQMLFGPLFRTGWMIDDCLMEASENPPETVVMSSASSKTAMALAHCLKARGNVDTVGLTSLANKVWLEGTGLYGRVRTYDDVVRLHARGLTAYVDFAGNPKLTADVHNALRDRLVRSLTVGATDWQAPRTPVPAPGPAPEFFFVPDYATARAKVVGADVLNQRATAALHAFYEASTDFITPVECRGEDAIGKAWADTLDQRIAPRDGLICSF